MKEITQRKNKKLSFYWSKGLIGVTDRLNVINENKEAKRTTEAPGQPQQKNVKSFDIPASSKILTTLFDITQPNKSNTP